MPLRKVSFNLFSALSLSTIAAFGVWWFNAGRLPHNFYGDAHGFDILLFLLVSYVLWHPIVMEILAWAIGSNIKDKSLRYEPLPGLKVAFITTFVPQSESIDLLYKSLPAMVAAEYPHDTWVLDEGNDTRVKAFCAAIGVKHFSRADIPEFNSERGKFARKTKGGNHNSWYESFGNNYDIVAQIDTDFVPSESFLTRTLGYFRDPKVAFVGTPQIYGNIKNSFIARGAAQQTYNFYGPILRGMDSMGTTMLIGANHVIRVAALKDVDHYSAHITEDLLTGMKLHARHWKSVYVPEALAIGEGPSTWQTYFNQQMRWAYGCIDVLLKHSPKLLPRMNFRRRLYYLWIQQHYFSGLAMIISLAGLGLYFFFGINTSSVYPLTFVGLYGLVLLGCGLMTWRLQRYNVRPREEHGFMLAGRILSIACWPVFFLALVGVVRGKRLTYKVTPKGYGETEKPDPVPLRVFSAHMVMGLYCLGCIAAAVFEHHRSTIMLAWAGSTALLMFSIPFVLVLHRLATNAGLAGASFARQLAGDLKDLERDLLPRLILNNRALHRRWRYLLGFSFTAFALSTVGEFYLLSSYGFHLVFWPLYGYLPLLLAGTLSLILVAHEEISALADWGYPNLGQATPYNQAGFVYNIYSAAKPIKEIQEEEARDIGLFCLLGNLS